MKVIILVGGLGTRLRPLTDKIPKPFLPIKGKPIVQYAIDNLKHYGINDIILAVSYHADKIKSYFKDGKEFGVNISYSLEETPLGTGGAVKQAAKEINEDFLLLWGDNLMDINLGQLCKQHKETNAKITMTLTQRKDVENFGVATLSKDKIVSFVEKPKREDTPSNLINAGAFIINPMVLNLLPVGKSSIEKDCFEKIVLEGNVYSYIHNSQWFPTDTLEKYKLADKMFERPLYLKSKKYIVADVDQTICESCQVVSNEMSREIVRLIDLDYTFIFVSGTKIKDLYNMISDNLPRRHYILGTSGANGVYIDENKKSKELFNKKINIVDRKEVIAALNKLSKKYNIISLTTKEDQIQDRLSQITFSAIGRHANSILKKEYDPDLSKRKEWVLYLKSKLPKDKYDLLIGGTTSIDITYKGVNKRSALIKLMSLKGITSEEILFFGDRLYPGGNDFELYNLVDNVLVKEPKDTLNIFKTIKF
jgi:mannose-1-phosphate guanylyltransferase